MCLQREDDTLNDGPLIIKRRAGRPQLFERGKAVVGRCNVVGGGGSRAGQVRLTAFSL